MNIGITFLALLLITLVGFVIIKAINVLPKKSNLFILSLGYGLGIGILYTQLYLYSRIHIPWNQFTILFPWVIVLVFFYKYLLSFSIPKKITLDKLSLFFLTGIIISMAYTLFEALLRPVTTWDGWASWLFKAKVFFIEGQITPQILSYVGAEYPLVINLLGTYIYTLLGRIDDTSVLLTSFAFYFFLSIGFFSVIQKEYGTKYALFATFLFVTIQNFVRHGGRIAAGQADLPLGYYIFFSTMLLLEYYKTSSKKVLILLSIFLGITGLIKVEGMPLTMVMVLLIGYVIYTKRVYSHLWLLLFWLFPIMEWNIYKKVHNLSYTGEHAFWFSLEAFPYVIYDVVQRIIKELITIKTWNMLWITYFFTLLFLSRKINKELFLINIIILSQLSLYLIIYLFLTGFHPESSIERLLVHIAPLALYVVVVRAKQLLFS